MLRNYMQRVMTYLLPLTFNEDQGFLTKIAIISLLHKTFKSSLLQELVLQTGHEMTIKMLQCNQDLG
jgi:hypothetical protein